MRTDQEYADMREQRDAEWEWARQLKAQIEQGKQDKQRAFHEAVRRSTVAEDTLIQARWDKNVQVTTKMMLGLEEDRQYGEDKEKAVEMLDKFRKAHRDKVMAHLERRNRTLQPGPIGDPAPEEDGEDYRDSLQELLRFDRAGLSITTVTATGKTKEGEKWQMTLYFHKAFEVLFNVAAKVSMEEFQARLAQDNEYVVVLFDLEFLQEEWSKVVEEWELQRAFAAGAPQIREFQTLEEREELF